MILGSAGCLPAVAGSLPATSIGSQVELHCLMSLGRLPRLAGWQPALPSTGCSASGRSAHYEAWVWRTNLV